MNWIDFVIIILLVFGLARGYINGFVKELASLLALILGIWGAIKFSSWTAARLYDYFDMTGRYVGIIAFLVTFIVNHQGVGAGTNISENGIKINRIF